MWQITGRDNAGLAQEVLSLEIEAGTILADAFAQQMPGVAVFLEMKAFAAGGLDKSEGSVKDRNIRSGVCDTAC